MESSDEIRNLLATYCERIDRGDFDGVGQLFSRGGLADEEGNVFATGAEPVADVPLRPIITGRYRDTFRRHEEDGWCFFERRFFVDLAGDLSLHLKPAVTPDIRRTEEPR